MALNLSTLQYNINIVFSVIAIAFVVLFIDIKAAIIGYSIMALGILGIIFLLFALLGQSQLNQGVGAMIYNIMYNSTPTLIILVILSWLITMVVVNYDRITSDAVPDDFLTFLNIANFILIGQFISLKYYITDQLANTKNITEGKPAPDNGSYTTIMLYLLSTINIVILGICQVIIKYYSTDG
tara:strand:+ start:276 stop:824 length:549 start_codon:yes stop_codon:yes gene_type:complete